MILDDAKHEFSCVLHDCLIPWLDAGVDCSGFAITPPPARAESL